MGNEEQGLSGDYTEADKGEMSELIEGVWADLGVERQAGREKRAKRLERKREEREEEPKFRQERREEEEAEGKISLEPERKEKLLRGKSQAVGKATVREFLRESEDYTVAMQAILSKHRKLLKTAGEGWRNPDGFLVEEGVISENRGREKYQDARAGTEDGLKKISFLSPEEQVEFLYQSFEEGSPAIDYFEKGLERIEDLVEKGLSERLVAIRILETSMEASMVGTPEYSAYVAGKHEQVARYGEVSVAYPVSSGSDSGIGSGGQIGDWKAICGEYRRIEKKVREEHPEAEDEQVRAWAISRAKKEYADSYSLHSMNRSHTSSYQPTFAQAVAYGQMNKKVQGRIWGIVQAGYSVEGIERFSGRGAKEDVKVQSMRREQEFLERQTEEVGVSNEREIQKQEQFREKEKARINHKYDKLGEKLESERRREENERERAEALEKLDAECEEKIEYFRGRTEEQRNKDRQARIKELMGKIEKRKSVLEKALDLQFAYIEASKNGEWEGGGDVNSRMWVEWAKFGDIKRAHRMLRRGASAQEIESWRVHQRLERLTEGLEDKDLVERIQRADLSGRGALIEDYFRAIGEKQAGRRIGRHSEMLAELDRQKFLEYISREPELEWLTLGEMKQFPFRGGDKARELWCAKNSVVDLPDFPEGRMGKIIYTRLRAGVDTYLHDASFWLENFRVPERGQDIERIKAEVGVGAEGVKEKFERGEYVVELKNPEKERDLLWGIVGMPVEERKKLRLSGKEAVIGEMFADSAERWLYEEVLGLYKSDLSTKELSEEVIRRMQRAKDELEGGGEVGKMSRENAERIEGLIEGLNERLRSDAESTTPRQISERMRELREIGRRRKKYIDDTTSWLTRHMTTPHQDLVRAWTNDARAMALAFGEADNARTINAFLGRRGVVAETDYMRQRGTSLEEIEGEYKGLVDEVVRCGGYSARTAIDIVGEYKEVHNAEKVVPADMRAIEVGGKKYKAGILAHDDPRGYTIGPDTGCCMHYGGASASCIRQGYSDKQAGFFAMYDPDNRLSAQSFFYVNPKRPEVLVLDNIEARGRGRDAERIVDVYKEYFQGFLTEQFEKNPEWAVREVHIGTRYGELVQPIVNKLPGVEIVENHNRATYTDAGENQVLLMQLSDREIEEAKLRGAIGRGEVEMSQEEGKELAGERIEAEQVQVRPNHGAEEFASRLGLEQGEILRELEARLYPEGMRQYGDEEFLDSELMMPKREDFSFVINSEQDGVRRPVGYCLAYEARSEVEPSEKCVYVADFGILSEERGGWAALRGFRELIRRVKDGGGGAIEMGARESTSYRLFSAPSVQKILGRLGYGVRDLGVEDEFAEGERTFLLRLDPVAQGAN